jgi:hypothetical protein
MPGKLQYLKADSRFLRNPDNVLSNETMLYSDEGTEKLVKIVTVNFESQ